MALLGINVTLPVTPGSSDSVYILLYSYLFSIFHCQITTHWYRSFTCIYVLTQSTLVLCVYLSLRFSWGILATDGTKWVKIAIKPANAAQVSIKFWWLQHLYLGCTDRYPGEHTSPKVHPGLIQLHSHNMEDKMARKEEKWCNSLSNLLTWSVHYSHSPPLETPLPLETNRS